MACACTKADPKTDTAFRDLYNSALRSSRAFSSCGPLAAVLRIQKLLDGEVIRLPQVGIRLQHALQRHLHLFVVVSCEDAVAHANAPRSGIYRHDDHAWRDGNDTPRRGLNTEATRLCQLVEIAERIILERFELLIHFVARDIHDGNADHNVLARHDAMDLCQTERRHADIRVIWGKTLELEVSDCGAQRQVIGWERDIELAIVARKFTINC